MLPEGFQSPTLNQLQEEFRFMRESVWNGVPGVLVIDSGVVGPTLGITVCTHGNEPSGIAALWYLRNHLRLQDVIVQGKVICTVNNLEASERYFNALTMPDGPDRDAARRRARFCDINMNLLPADVIDLTDDNRYEIRRAQELRPVWEQFDIAFDIHSVAKKGSQPTIVACGGLLPELLRGFPVETIITNIEQVQIGKPAVHFYGQGGRIKTIAIEAGSHEDSSSFICSIACAISLLQNLGMIEGSGSHEVREYQEYYVDGSVMFPHESCAMVRAFGMFESVEEGEELARGEGAAIVASFSGHILMAPPNLTVDSIYEEAFFLARPVRTIRI